ncbi:MAG TPA: G1 family glutamic endopeptidase [Candidatus Eremiobacteraceae bacterium]|nr:G1 family glutamic endopeptidase [Candidatus Eremiobacteraceae bacterium]
MLSKKLGSLFALVIVPALAQVPISPASPQTASVISPRQHAPRRVAGLRPDRVIDNVTVSDSTNWSGYAVTGSSFTHAAGSWIVPTVNCSKTPNTYSSFWVGIDGWTSSTVEQTGTDSDCNGSSPSYYAWYEFYPNPSFLISSVPMSPGNKVSAAVTYNGTEFTITITNETTGKSFSKSSRVRGAKRSSAEWIAEAPCCTNAGGILPLADFGIVDFGQDYTDISSTNDATDSSITGPIGSFGNAVNEAIMVNGSTGADEAVPSSLTTDGSSFTVTWDSE